VLLITDSTFAVEQTEVVEALCLEPKQLMTKSHDWDSKKDKIPFFVTKESLKGMKNVKNLNQFVLGAPGRHLTLIYRIKVQ